MKLKVLSYLLTVFALFGLTGCFELEEKAHFNKDGSGNYQFTIDLAKLGSFINMMEALDQNYDNKEESTPKDEIKEGFEKSKSELSGIKGISNVTAIEDEENFRFGFSFDFKDINALNAGMNKIFDVKKDGEPVDMTFFSFKKGRLQRFEQDDMSDILNKANEDSEMEIDAGAFMKDFRFTTIYTFEEPIKNVSNQQVMLSPDRKTVTNSVQPFNTDSKNLSLQNIIDF
jgi:hypothetical protein